MFIKIIKILDYKNKIVEFSSKYGKAIGQWSDDSFKEGKEYDVEIDIPQKVIWNLDIKTTDEKKDKIEVINNKIVIVGQLYSIEDNCVYIKLGINLIFVEVDSLIDIRSTKVICKLDKIVLYDTHLI